MSNTSKKVYLIAMIITGAFLILCTGFYTYSLLSEYSPLNGQFAKGPFSDVFLPLIYIVALVAFAVFGFLFRTSLSGRKYKNVLSALFASGFAALSLLVWLVSFASDFFGGSHAPAQTVFGVLLIVFAASAIVYFIFSATPNPPHTYTVLFSMGTVLFLLLYAFYAYFDSAFALNSPVKLLDQLSAITLMFFFLAEIRFRFGAISEALFLPLGMTAVLFSASNGIGALIYAIAEERPLVVLTMHDFLFLALSLYALVRLIAFLLPPLFREEGIDNDASPSAFEAESGIPHATSDPEDPAQETFDFDKEPEELVRQATETRIGSAEEDNETAATIDFDTP